MREEFGGVTSFSQYIVLRNATTGVGLAGKLFSDVTGSYTRTRAARTAITMATLASASAAWSSGGFIEVDGTNCPGLYRFDIPDAAFAAGVDKVIVSVKVTGAIEEHIEFVITTWNKQVAAIPNVAAGANGGLPLGDAAGKVTLAPVTHTSAVIPTVTTLTNAPPDSSGTTTLTGRLTAQRATNLDNLDAAVTSRLAPTAAGRTLDVAATGEAGLDFDNVKDATAPHTLTNITVPTVTTYTGNTPQTGDAFARLGAPAGASIAADIATRLATSGYTAPPSAAAIAAQLIATTLAELTQAIFPATPTVGQALMLPVHMLARGGTFDKNTGISTVLNNAGVVILKRTDTDDGSILTEGSLVSGP